MVNNPSVANASALFGPTPLVYCKGRISFFPLSTIFFKLISNHFLDEINHLNITTGFETVMLFPERIM